MPWALSFDWKSYLLMYLLFQYGALPLAILFSAAVYQLTRRLDLSLVLFGAFAALSLTVWSENWQLSWLNPCVWAFLTHSPTIVCFDPWRTAA